MDETATYPTILLDLAVQVIPLTTFSILRSGTMLTQNASSPVDPELGRPLYQVVGQMTRLFRIDQGHHLFLGVTLRTRPLATSGLSLVPVGLSVTEMIRGEVEREFVPFALSDRLSNPQARS